MTHFHHRHLRRHHQLPLPQLLLLLPLPRVSYHYYLSILFPLSPDLHSSHFSSALLRSHLLPLLFLLLLLLLLTSPHYCPRI